MGVLQAFRDGVRAFGTALRQAPPPESKLIALLDRLPPDRVETLAKAMARVMQKQGGGDGNAILNLLRYPPNTPVYSTLTSTTRQNQIRHYRGWVYVAIRAIAEKVAQLRPCVGHTARGGTAKHLSKSMRRRLKATTNIRDNEDIEPVDDTHPLVQLLDNPNDPDTACTLWYRTLLFWELCGKAYWWLPKNKAGLPCEIWVLPTHWVTPLGGDNALVEKYQIQPLEGTYKSSYLDAEDVLPILHPSPVSIVDGYSALDGGGAWVDQQDAMDAARVNQMQNAHNAGMILQLEKGMEVPQKGDLDAAYAMLQERLRGPGKNRMPLILPPGWESGGRYGLTAEELDYNASFDQVRDMVLALYRVPKGVLGIEPGVDQTSAYAPNLYMYDHCVNPKLHYLGQILTEKLAARFDEGLRIYWENSAPLDPEQERIKRNDAFDRGVIDQDFYAQDLGFPSVDDSMRLVTSNYVPMPTGDLGVDPLLGGETPGITPADSTGGEGGITPAEGEEGDDAPDFSPPKKSLRKSRVPEGAIKVHMPNVRQETRFSCGAACFEAVARMYGVGPDDESWYREALDSDPEAGTPPENLRELADQLGLRTVVRRGMSREALRAELDRGTPVILLMQAWGDPATYDGDANGHYVVAIGYTADEVIVMDPSLRLARGWVDWEGLDRRWHDVGMDGTKYDRWGMAVSRDEVMRPVKAKPKFSQNGKH